MAQRIPGARTPLATSETGAILPIFALLIVVLLVFAAFTVDLGAAWTKRRELQSAADAGAMAAVLPLPPDVTSIAEAALIYAKKNSDVELDGCAGWTPASADVPGTFVLADADYDCVWISAETAVSETLVVVKIPVQQVPTSFARLIGIDNISVDAFAVAENTSIAAPHILPFALSSNPGGHECLGSPPAGISRNPCSGSTTGNFGFIGSFFKDVESLGTPNSCDPAPTASLTDSQILAMNMAIGTDHPVQNDVKWPAATANADFLDVCDGKAFPTYIPDSVLFLPGVDETALHSGLVSADVFGDYGTSSRLQQNLKAGVGSDLVLNKRTIENKTEPDSVLDNIGLWEYIDEGSGDCDPDLFSDVWETGGSPATIQMELCLEEGDPVTFVKLLWESPRFAVIPEMHEETFPTGKAPLAIKRFRGVYLHAAWFNCNASDGADACLTFIEDDVDGTEWPIFYPGEGSSIACEPLGEAVGCKNSQIRGISALVLPIASVPLDVINGSSANVRLLRR